MTKALVFPGQGSQTIGMGKELYENFICARVVFDEVDSALSRKLSKIIFDGDMDQLTRTDNAQPALMAMSMAVLSVMQIEYGFNPLSVAFMAGHSLGEYSALCSSGALSLANTAVLLQKRGEAMLASALKKKGKMAVVLGLTKEQIEDSLSGEVFIANDNCVGQVVISGAEEDVDKASEILERKGAKRVLPLAVSGAFHSSLMQQASEEMTETLLSIPMQAPKVPLISNVTGQPIRDVTEIRQLLIKQIVSPVLWTQSVQLMAKEGVDTFIEVGNGKVLSGLIKRTEPTASAISLNTILSMQEFFSLDNRKKEKCLI